MAKKKPAATVSKRAARATSGRRGRPGAARRRPAAGPQRAPRGAGEAEWTVMVYMAGDNDLDDFGARDIAEMKRVGSNDRISILVQRDTAAAGVTTRRYRLRKGTSVAADVVPGGNLGETNTGDPRTFADFLDWGLEHAPAKKTMVVLWNHGAGWDDADIYAAARQRSLATPEPRGTGPRRGAGRGSLPAGFVRRSAARRRHRGPFFLSDGSWVKDGPRRAIAFDDQAQDFLDNVEIKTALDAAAKKAGRPFEVIGMDACLMAMVETGMQVAAAGKVLCASQEVEPADGWPYESVLATLAGDPAIDGLGLAARIAEAFVESYPKNEKATQSVVDLRRIAAVGAAADGLGGALEAALAGRDALAVRGAIGLARGRTQSYDTADYVDLLDFTKQLAAVWNGARTEIAAVRRAVGDAVAANHAVHPDVARSCGLSIHFPLAALSPLYAKLVFGRGAWARFLAAYAGR